MAGGVSPVLEVIFPTPGSFVERVASPEDEREEAYGQKNEKETRMMYPDSFKLSTPSDREIEVTRVFDAPRALVFDAFTKPELVRRWLLGPPGWTMPVCDIDLK